SLFLGCKSAVENSVETSFFTQDSLYKITFDRPIELDTFYTWKDIDDNACSDERKYRFSKKAFPHQKETGFFWNSFVDSTYRITLKHVEGFQCKSQMDHERILEPRTYLSNIYLKFKNDNPKTNIDTLYSKSFKINELSTVVVAYRIKEDYYITHDFSNGYWTNYLKLLTEVDNNLFVLTADCRTKDCAGFIERMEKSFRTIRIEKNRH
ncbi:MAG TPA: hypothetical protein VF691_04490, partial [Cytophagaceae bacterium]